MAGCENAAIARLMFVRKYMVGLQNAIYVPRNVVILLSEGQVLPNRYPLFTRSLIRVFFL
jgi:hypothetical protein